MLGDSNRKIQLTQKITLKKYWLETNMENFHWKFYVWQFEILMRRWQKSECCRYAIKNFMLHYIPSRVPYGYTSLILSWMDTDSKPMSSHNFPRFQIKHCFLLGLGLLDLAVSIYLKSVFIWGLYWYLFNDLW